MKKKLLIVYLGVIFFSIFACTDDEDDPGAIICNTTNTNFNQLYQSLVSNPQNNDHQFIDLETHAYTFEVLSNKTVCKIGYQSLTYFNTTPYLIEIKNNTNNTVIYTGNHTFSSSATSYVDIPPLNLQTGNSYTIKREQTNWNGNFANMIGRVVTGPINFPITNGNIKINSSVFYGMGGPINNSGVPYIEIVFQ